METENDWWKYTDTCKEISPQEIIDSMNVLYNNTINLVRSCTVDY